jgi:hypothetical protein
MPAQQTFCKFVWGAILPFLKGLRLSFLWLLIHWERLNADFIDPVIPTGESDPGVVDLDADDPPAGESDLMAAPGFVVAARFEVALAVFSMELTRLVEALKHRVGNYLAVTDPDLQFLRPAMSASHPAGFYISVIYPYEQDNREPTLWVPGVGECSGRGHSHRLVTRRIMCETGRLLHLATKMEQSLRDAVGPDSPLSLLRLNAGYWTFPDGSRGEIVRWGEPSSAPRKSRPIRVFPVGTGHDILVEHQHIFFNLDRIDKHFLYPPLVTNEAPAWDVRNSLQRFHCGRDRRPPVVMDDDDFNSHVPLPNEWEWNEYAGRITCVEPDIQILLSLCMQALPLMEAMWRCYGRIESGLNSPRQYVFAGGSSLPIRKQSVLDAISKTSEVVEGYIVATKHRFCASVVSMIDPVYNRSMVMGTVADPGNVIFPHEMDPASQDYRDLPPAWLATPMVRKSLCLVGSLFYVYRLVIHEMGECITGTPPLRRALIPRNENDPTVKAGRFTDVLTVAKVFEKLEQLKVSDRMRQNTRDCFMKKSAGRCGMDPTNGMTVLNPF